MFANIPYLDLNVRLFWSTLELQQQLQQYQNHRQRQQLRLRQQLKWCHFDWYLSWFMKIAEIVDVRERFNVSESAAWAKRRLNQFKGRTHGFRVSVVKLSIVVDAVVVWLPLRHKSANVNTMKWKNKYINKNKTNKKSQQHLFLLFTEALNNEISLHVKHTGCRVAVVVSFILFNTLSIFVLWNCFACHCSLNQFLVTIFRLSARIDFNFPMCRDSLKPISGHGRDSQVYSFSKSNQTIPNPTQPMSLQWDLVGFSYTHTQTGIEMLYDFRMACHTMCIAVCEPYFQNWFVKWHL